VEDDVGRDPVTLRLAGAPGPETIEVGVVDPERRETAVGRDAIEAAVDNLLAAADSQHLRDTWTGPLSAVVGERDDRVALQRALRCTL
jgi:hypothetical protein